MRFIPIALVAAMIATPAAAQPRSITVKVTAADLASPAARAKLDRRVAVAIEQVCGSYATIETGQWPEMDSCWKSARAEVDERIAAAVSRSRQPVQLSRN